MSKFVLKKSIISISILIIGAILGYLMIVSVFFAFNISDEKTKDTLAILASEGYHPRESLRTGDSEYYHEPLPDILDFGTDEFIVRYSMENPSLPIRVYSIIPEYYRYWHGYIVFLRPLFKVMDLSEIRIFNMIVQMFLSFYLAYLLFANTKKKRYFLAWVSIYTIMIPNALSCNFQYSSIYYVTVVSSIVLLSFKDFFLKNKNYVYLFLLSGMATVYFDFLTYPILSWAVPATILILLNPNKDKNKKIGRDISTVVLSAVIWSIGYVVFWAEKWLIAFVSTSENSFGNAFGEFLNRSGMGSLGLNDRIDSILLNWSHMNIKPIVLILAGWIVFLSIQMIKKGISSESRVPAFSIIMLSPVVWYLFAAQHTHSHSLFAWRNSLATLFAFWMMICCLTDNSVEKGKILLKKGVPSGVMLLACAALSVIAYCIIPVEKTSSFNFDLTDYATRVELDSNSEDAVSIEFVPQHSILTELTPIIECEDKTITPTLKIYKDDKLIWSKKIKSKESSNIYETRLWKLLKKGETYRISISTVGIDEPMSIWVLEDKRTLEYAKNKNGILNGFGYYVPFANTTSVVFIISTYIMVLLSVTISVITIIDIVKLGKLDEKKNNS